MVLVEVQLLKNARKPPTWLLYQAAAQVRHGCDVVVLVIAPDARVARWARRPLPVGPSGRYAPVVLGPTDVPSLAALDVEHASPELAVLSLLAHGKRAERAVILRATRSWRSSPRWRSCTSTSFVLSLESRLFARWRTS